MWSLKNRIEHHLDGLLYSEIPTFQIYHPETNSFYNQPIIPGTYWVVTHGIVISKIKEYFINSSNLDISIHWDIWDDRPKYTDALVCTFNLDTKKIDLYNDLASNI